MKEIGKLLLSGLIAAGLLFTAACAPEKEDPPRPSPGGEKTTIVDAYDKGARPDYDGKFDYKSGYTPSEPATEAVITIADSSSVKFKDGTKKMTLTVGKLLTQEDFDATSLDGKKIGGVAIMFKTEGEEPKEYISAFAPLSDFVPTAAVTVSPYFAPEKGESILWGSNGKDWADKITPASITEEKALINGYMGLKVSYGAEIKSGASIRYKATMNVKRDERYAFRYTFVNYGTEELKFNLYQMKGGSNYDDPETAIASEAITLKAGETSKTIELTLTSTKNDTNSLTGLRFNSDMTSASFGVIMSVEDTTERLPAKITLDLPTGFTVKDYKTDVLTNTQLTLPAASQIDNKTGHNLLYWVDGNGNKVTTGTKITGNMTIKPVLSETVTITFDLPSGFTLTDFKTEVKVETETKFTLPAASQINNKTGRKFIRWADGNGNPVANGFTVKGDLTITPELSAPAKITVSLPDGLTVSKDYVTDIQTGDVIVAPTSAQISGEIKEGRKIAGWYIVGGKNTIITDKTIAEAEKITIAPYFTRAAGTATLQNFGNANDGQPLVFSNVQNSLKPLTVYDGVELDKFDAISSKYKNDTVIGGGANGFAELGNVLSYNGTMSVGSAFRCGTIVSDPYKNIPVVALGLEHTFIYNFQNFGTSKISLTIQGVNTGKEVEGPISNIILEPGESTTVRFGVTYTKGSANKNVIGFFTVKEELTNMKLGVSVNVIFGRKTINVKTTVDKDITLSAQYLARVYKAGDKLVLPTSADYTDALSAEREIIGWKNVKTGETITGEVILSSDIEIAPVFRSLLAPRAYITLKATEGFTLTDEYLSAERRTGEVLVLPTSADYTDLLSAKRRVIGWKNAKTGEEIPAGYVLEGDLELVPVFEDYVDVAVTLGEGVTFKTGEKTLELTAGSALPEITAPANFKGFYVDGEVVAAADYVVPNKAVTLYPVYEGISGYTYLPFGSGKITGYNNDLTPGNDMYSHEGFAYEGLKSGGGAVKIVKGEGDYYVYGSFVKDTAKNYAGTAMRFDSKYSTALTKDTVVEFSYVVENKGTAELALSIYQISGSAEYKAASGYYGYESRYRVDVRLNPGESKKYTAQYLLGKNGNALTYIVFEKDADNFSFGIAVSEKVLADKTAVDDKYGNQEALINPATLTFEAGETGITVNAGYLNKFRAGKFITAPSSSDFEANGATIEKWQITFDGKAHDLPTTVADYSSLRMPSAGATLTAVVTRDVTVTYEKPDSVTAEGGKTSYKTGEKLSLPTLSGKDASGRTAIGWYDKATHKIVTNETVINDDLTLTPYYAPAKGEALTPLSGATINDKYGPDSLSAGLTQTFVKQTDVIVGGEKGITLAYTALKTGDAFRFKTKYSLLANKTYKFNYVFENFGSEDLTFTLYQLKGGTNTDGMPNKLVTIKAGETQTVELTLNTGKNGNILTYFVIGKDVSALNLGIAMSISEETA